MAPRAIAFCLALQCQRRTAPHPAHDPPSQRLAKPAVITTGLLGGSFNPAHGAHRAISLNAIAALDLDELWWLVSPGNPRSEEHTSELQSLMRISYAVFCLNKKILHYI